MKKNCRYILSKAAVCTLIFTLLIGGLLSTDTAGALGGLGLNSGVISYLINEDRVDIAPGVVQKTYKYNDREGKRTDAYVLDIDMKNPFVSIKAGTPDGGDTIGLQTTREMSHAVSKEGYRVVAAVNADYFNMEDGKPFGIVYKDGRAVKADQYSTWRFFGITKDGKAVIGDVDYYSQIKDNLKEALGGQAILVKDGRIFEAPQYNAGRNPRTAVGIKANGDVFFIVIDGRQEPYSSGITGADLAQIMIDLGAVTALDLDGGGSTTYLSRKPGEDYLQLVNVPSGISERRVANSWLIVSTAKSDHIFDSAFIEPYNKSFTPMSTVQFSARGRDKSLSSAPLPTYGLSWELSDSSYGTIDYSGKFISSGKTGQFQILLKYNGKIAGSTWVEIQNPDRIYFETPYLTVLKNSEQSLNLVTEYYNRRVEWKKEDMEWWISPGLGYLDGNGVLRTNENSVSGRVIARLKGTYLTAEASITVSQPPETLFTFENSQGNWTASTVGRGENGALGLIYNQKRPESTGYNSLRIDYDFTSGQKEATLGVYAGPGSIDPIPGNPTSIGMWIYAGEEAKGYWLRMAVIDGLGEIHNINLTSGAGIDWTGWKYLEARVPSGLTYPLHLHPMEAIRIMSVNAGVTGPMSKGSIFVDDITAVYADNNYDYYPPVIESVNVMNEVYNTNYISIKVNIRDYGRTIYSSGVNKNKIKIAVDGVEYNESSGRITWGKDDSATLSSQYYGEGIHEVKVTAWDNSGNQAEKTVYFTIKAR